MIDKLNEDFEAMCFFCGTRKTRPQNRHCGSRECQKADDRIGADFANEICRQRRQAVWFLLTRWGQTSEWFGRRANIADRIRLALYALKALICLTWRLRFRRSYRYGIDLGSWGMTDSNGWHWIEVGRGWNEWWAFVDSEWPEIR